MIAHGLSWGAFAALYGALAAAAILIFLLRFARRGRAVSSTLIWFKVMGVKRSLWKELVSLALQLILLGLVCLALVDPRPPEEDIQRKWVAVIVDVSESMAAREGDASRLRLAEREAWLLMSQLGQVDRIMLVSAGPEVDIMTPFTSNKEELKKALTNLSAAGTRPKIDQAIAYARSAFDYAGAGPQDQRYLFVYTDRPDQVARPDAKDLEFRVVAVGQTRSNLAITSFDVRRTMNLSSAYDALVKVNNFSKSAAGAELAIFSPQTMLGTQTFRLEPGQTYTKVLGLPLGALGKITALLRKTKFDDQAPDALASDDAAFSFVLPLRRAKVLLVTQKNLFLHNALALDPEVDLMSIGAAEYHHALSTMADVAVFDGYVPPQLPACNAVYFNPGPGSPFAIKEKKKKPAMTSWADGHPLLSHVQMDTMTIETASIFTPADKDVVLMGHYDGALILLRPQGDQFMLGVGLDLTQSDFPLQPAFPIFMHNVVHVFSHRPEEEVPTGYHLGERVDLTLAAGRQQVVLMDPLEKKIPLPVRGGRAFFRPAAPGFYTYAEGDALRVFAASLTDENESNLTVPPGDAPPVFPGRAKEKATEIIWPWLVLTALILAAADMVLFLNGKLS